MSQNRQTLTELYRRIAVGGVVESVKNCGLSWTQTTASTYKSTLTQGGEDWDVSLTRMPGDLIVLDFGKDGVFQFSLNSVEDDKLPELYSDVEGSVELEADEELLSYLATLSERCA